MPPGRNFEWRWSRWRLRGWERELRDFGCQGPFFARGRCRHRLRGFHGQACKLAHGTRQDWPGQPQGDSGVEERISARARFSVSNAECMFPPPTVEHFAILAYSINSTARRPPISMKISLSASLYSSMVPAAWKCSPPPISAICSISSMSAPAPTLIANRV